MIKVRIFLLGRMVDFARLLREFDLSVALIAVRQAFDFP